MRRQSHHSPAFFTTCFTVFDVLPSKFESILLREPEDEFRLCSHSYVNVIAFLTLPVYLPNRFRPIITANRDWSHCATLGFSAR